MKATVGDLRNAHRYKQKDSVAIATSESFQVINLSKGGFCFRCSRDTFIPDSWDTDIITSVGHLSDYRVKLVWAGIKKAGSFTDSSKVAGVQFVNLTEDQKSRVTQLIRAVSKRKAIKYKTLVGGAPNYASFSIFQ